MRALYSRLAELHRRRAAVEQEIAEVYENAAGGEKPRKRRAKVELVQTPSDEVMNDVGRTLAGKGFR